VNAALSRTVLLLSAFALFIATACGGESNEIDAEGAILVQDAITATDAIGHMGFRSETTVTVDETSAGVIQDGRALDGGARVYAAIERPLAPIIEVAAIGGIEYVRHTGSPWRCYNVPSAPLADFGFNPPDFVAYAALVDAAESISAPREMEIDGRPAYEVEVRLDSASADATPVFGRGLSQLVTVDDSSYVLTFRIDGDGLIQEMRAEAEVKRDGEKAEIAMLQRFDLDVSAVDFPLEPPYPEC
jgi:hypothetical protein